jgi:hypothetical protein
MKDAQYKNHKQLVEDCVDTFLGVGDSVLTQARGRAVGFDGMDRAQYRPEVLGERGRYEDVVEEQIEPND